MDGVWLLQEGKALIALRKTCQLFGLYLWNTAIEPTIQQKWSSYCQPNLKLYILFVRKSSLYKCAPISVRKYIYALNVYAAAADIHPQAEADISIFIILSWH